MKTIEMIKALEKEGYTIESPKDLIQIGNLFFTKPEEYTGNYNKIKIPRGFRLPTIQEMFSLNKKELKVLFKEYYGNIWIHVPCQQTELDKENKSSRWFYLYRGSGAGSYDWYLANSDDSGRVVFVKKKVKNEN